MTLSFGSCPSGQGFALGLFTKGFLELRVILGSVLGSSLLLGRQSDPFSFLSYILCFVSHMISSLGQLWQVHRTALTWFSTHWADGIAFGQIVVVVVEPKRSSLATS